METDETERAGGVLEETKRVARLLDIIARVSARPKVWTRGSLAEVYGISERRIQQDLEILKRRLGLPVEHCPTGYYFARPCALPAVTFGFGEASALLLAAGVGAVTSGVGSAELAAALARLKEAFPPEFRGMLGQLEAREPDPVGERRRKLLELLQEARATQTSVWLRYATASRGGAESERLVDPYVIVPYVRSFHLVGLCHYREKVLTFKVDRILELKLTAERFEVPADFDSSAYLGQAWGLMRGTAGPSEAVRIRFTAQAGRWVSEERWHASQKAEWQPDGTLLFSVEVGITPEFVHWILYYGPEAEVLAPRCLAEAVQQEARALVELYEAQAT